MKLLKLLVLLIALLDGRWLLAEVVRPQAVVDPRPYSEQALTIDGSQAEPVLAATFTLPARCERCAVVLLLGVAGPNDRDLAFAGHRAFALIADRLARAGIGSLRWDDRGVGGSGGDWSQSSYGELRDDVLRALRLARAHPQVDAQRLALFGLSEGALIAAMAAAEAEEPLAALVLASPPGVAGELALRSQFERTLALSGIVGEPAQTYRSAYDRFVALTRQAASDPQQLSALSEFLAGPGRTLLPPYGFLPKDPAAQAALFAGPWYQSQLDAEPSLHYQRIDAPVLLLSGDRDLILPAEENIPPIRNALPQAQWLRFADVSHLLQPSQSGLPTEYAKQPLTIEPALLEQLVDWLGRQLLR